MRFEKYLLSAFFTISTTKSVDKNKVVFDDTAPYDFIGRTSVNYGVQGHINKRDFDPNPKDSFSLVQVGETVALWRENEWYASQNIFLLKPKFDRIKDCFLYFQSVINKEMTVYGKAYNSYPTMASLSNTYIILPTLDVLDKDSPYSSDGFVPDFDYMKTYIEELKLKHVEELESEYLTILNQYLITMGINDYELTDANINDLVLALKPGVTKGQITKMLLQFARNSI